MPTGDALILIDFHSTMPGSVSNEAGYTATLAAYRRAGAMKTLAKNLDGGTGALTA